MTRTLTLVLASVFLSAPAFGGVLYTAPASAAFTGGHLSCGFRNLSTTPRDVTVEHLDFAGNVVAAHTFEDVEPDTSYAFGNWDNEQSVSCRFVFAGSTKRLQAAAEYLDDGVYEIVIPAE